MGWGNLLTAAGVVGGLSLAQKQREKGKKMGGKKGGSSKKGSGTKEGGVNGGIALAAAALAAVPTPVAAIFVGAAAAGFVANLILKRGQADNDGTEGDGQDASFTESSKVAAKSGPSIDLKHVLPSNVEGDDADGNVVRTPGGRRLSNLKPLTVEDEDTAMGGGLGFSLDKPQPMSPTKVPEAGDMSGQDVDLDLHPVPLLTPREFFSDNHGWGRTSGSLTSVSGKGKEEGTAKGTSSSFSGTTGKPEAPGTPPQKSEPLPAVNTAASASAAESAPPRSKSFAAVVKAASQGSPLSESGGDLGRNRSWTWGALQGFIERRMTVSPSSSVKSQMSASSSVSKDAKDPDSPSLGLVESQTKFTRADSGSFDTAPNSPEPGTIQAQNEENEQKGDGLSKGAEKGKEEKVKNDEVLQSVSQGAQPLINGEAESGVGEKAKAAVELPAEAKALVQQDERVRALLNRARAASQRATAMHANILEIGAKQRQGEKE
eukprot:TRINITY_DN352_c0_g5_i1.p1 TRINITY_DN352_c0_g5~~TRINITY_DN352_c0_g5_i1.p1  ORF type:complete len:489 (-),score=102.71 TRINITY_DN352_c0_g5_i1:195-1661(-)